MTNNQNTDGTDTTNGGTGPLSAKNGIKKEQNAQGMDNKRKNTDAFGTNRPETDQSNGGK